jgi:hypothetical protein
MPLLKFKLYLSDEGEDAHKLESHLRFLDRQKGVKYKVIHDKSGLNILNIKVTVPSKKPFTRKRVMHLIKILMGKDFFVKTTEEFSGIKGGIWTGAESGGIDGLPLADYYEQIEGRDGFKNIMKVSGWYWEWYDPGTIEIFPE